MQIMERPSGRGEAFGFSLIEVMVVVAIIGIIATIALPAYQEYVIKSRREAGKSCLMQAAQQAERFYTTNLTYAGLPGAFACDSSTAPFYAVTSANAGAKTYTLSAAPQGSHADAKCGTLSVNQAGARSPATAGCW